MANVIESFSYDLRSAATVQAAKERAKEQGVKSFSKYILKLLEEDSQKNLESLKETRLPILNTAGARQSTITEYDIKLFQRPEERFAKLKNLNRDQHKKVSIEVCYLQQQIRDSK